MAQPPERYPVQGITEAIDFLQLIEDRFASNPAIRKGFFALLADFCHGVTTDARAVVARANELLQGHPDLVDRFQVFLDPEAAAKQFLERVKHADVKVYDAVLAELPRVDEDRGLDAHEIYARFRSVLGSDNGDLLRRFAHFLPTTRYDPPPPCAKPERRSKAKKRGMDDGPTPMHHLANSYAGADAAGSSRPSRAKKRRVHDHDGQKPKCNSISYDGAGAVGSSGPSRAKKPRADHGDNPCTHLAGAANGTGRGAASRDDDRNEVSRFREAWELETGYSKLVATMARAEELQRERAHVASVSHGRRRAASLEELFPSRECRECLAGMYRDAWGTMRRLLEDDGYIAFALAVILERLRVMEAAAVEAARSWRDPTRAAHRLNDLVQDRVREEREQALKAERKH